MMNKRYQEEWDRLLQKAREAIEIATDIQTVTMDMRKAVRNKEITQFANEYLDLQREEYTIITDMISCALKTFKGKNLEIEYSEGLWKENAMLFVIADSVSASRTALYLNPQRIFKQGDTEKMLNEIKNYIGDDLWSKYVNFIKCGFVSIAEEEYLTELIIPN